MKKTAYLFLLMSAAECYARGWPTNAWPSYNYPFAGMTHRSNVVQALQERDPAAGFTNTVARWDTRYFDQRSYLTLCKTNAMSYFTAGTLISHWAIDAWTNTTADAPFMTWTGLCDRLDIPTNYLTYTPWSFLSGLGVFTNDAAVGHAYGYTNAFTVVGGPYLPSGRTNWYTTDYGWDNLRRIIDNIYAFYTEDEYILSGGR